MEIKERIKKELMILANQFIVLVIILFLAGIFLGDYGPILRNFPEDAWRMIEIQVYGNGLVKAIGIAVVIFFLWKVYQIYQKEEKEILKAFLPDLSPQLDKILSYVIPIGFIFVGWYLIGGGGTLKNLSFVVTRENFPFFGAPILVVSALFEFPPKSIFTFVNLVAFILGVLVVLKKTEEKKEG